MADEILSQYVKPAYPTKMSGRKLDEDNLKW